MLVQQLPQAFRPAPHLSRSGVAGEMVGEFAQAPPHPLWFLNLDPPSLFALALAAASWACWTVPAAGGRWYGCCGCRSSLSS